MNHLSPQVIFAAFGFLCAALAAVVDVRLRRIPNWITGPAIPLGLLIHGIHAGWAGVADSALAGVSVGVLFLVFHIAGGLGAGDVKAMAAIGFLQGMAGIWGTTLATVAAGAIAAIVTSLRHGRLRETLRNTAELIEHHRRHGLRRHEELNVDRERGIRLPFGVPIAAGCLFTLCMAAWERGI